MTTLQDKQAAAPRQVVLPSGNTVNLSVAAIRAGADIFAHFRRALPSLPERNAETLALIIELETHVGELLELAKGYEQWEADLVLCSEAWDRTSGDLPEITTELWEKLLLLQTKRNLVIAKAEGHK